jgi:hypothetical protein
VVAGVESALVSFFNAISLLVAQFFRRSNRFPGRPVSLVRDWARNLAR